MRSFVVWCVWVLLAATSVSAEEVVLYDFYADWCGPCRTMAPVVSRLERDGVVVRRVNVDQQPDLARRFGVRHLPTFVLVVDGRERGRLVGAVPEHQLRALIQSARPGKPSGESTTAGRVAVPNEVAELLLRSSVRMYRQTAGARYYGSGTIIFATDTEAIVLTCAHLFRSNSGLGQAVMVEWFGTEPPRTYRGRLIARDRNADLALVRIRTDRRLPAARVASAAVSLTPGTRLYSVGCDRGSRPRIYPTRLTAVDRYVGAPNYEILGAPRQGRSGGGLFTERGELVGVCSAADPYGNRGLFAALGAVHYLLSAARLDHLYRSPGSPREERTESPPVRFAHNERRHIGNAPLALPEPEALSVADVSTGAAEKGQLGEGGESASTRGGAEAEIICVIRPLGGSNQPSRVLVLRRADPKLIRLLEAHARFGAQGETAGMAEPSVPSSAVTVPASLTQPLSAERAAGPGNGPWRPARARRKTRLLAPRF